MESCLDSSRETSQKLGDLGVMIEHTRNITELNGVGSGVGAKQISTAAASSKKKTLENGSLVKECFGRRILTESIVRKTEKGSSIYLCVSVADNGADGPQILVRFWPRSNSCRSCENASLRHPTKDTDLTRGERFRSGWCATVPPSLA
jgi:hypothetical protein